MGQPMIATALRAGVLAVTAMTVLACTPEEPLEQRVDAYWKARMERNIEAAYRYEHPETRGDEESYRTRMGAAPLMINKVKVDEVTVDGDTAVAHLSVQYRHAAMSRSVKTKIADEWQRQGSTWYHRPPPPMPTRSPDASPVVAAPTPRDD